MGSQILLIETIETSPAVICSCTTVTSHNYETGTAGIKGRIYIYKK